MLLGEIAKDLQGFKSLKVWQGQIIIDLLHNRLNITLILQIIKIVTNKIISNHNNQCFLRSIFNSF